MAADVCLLGDNYVSKHALNILQIAALRQPELLRPFLPSLLLCVAGMLYNLSSAFLQVCCTSCPLGWHLWSGAEFRFCDPERICTQLARFHEHQSVENYIFYKNEAFLLYKSAWGTCFVIDCQYLSIKAGERPLSGTGAVCLSKLHGIICQDPHISK